VYIVKEVVIAIVIGNRKMMIQLTDLKICENCGNVFTKIIKGEPVNRCPACKVWKKEVAGQTI
jgi:predicted Zn-ribbon and HTH transcriptional regulator